MSDFKIHKKGTVVFKNVFVSVITFSVYSIVKQLMLH